MTTQPYVLGAVFARGGSKGVAGKNIRPLQGKPLIAHAIEIGRASKRISRIVVSTDSEAIADVARVWGAEVPFMRPAELAQDDSPEWLAWQHLLAEVSYAGPHVDALVSIPATAPLRGVEDVDACIDLLLGSDADVVVTMAEAHRNPYFNMLTRDPDGLVRIAIPVDPPLTRRQAAPEVFDMTTVAFAAKAAFVRRASGIFQGRMRAVVVPVERSLDIDTEFDFRLAEFLMSSRVERSS